MNLSKGFSLIELMVVIAIVAVLAGIAVPAYKDFADRAKIAAGLPLAQPIFDAVKLYVAKNNSFPGDPAQLGVPLDDIWYTAADAGGGLVNVDNNDVIYTQIVTYSSNFTRRQNSTAVFVSYKNGVNPDYPNSSSLVAYILYEDPVGSGIIKVKCGQWDDNYAWQSMPFRLLPSNCQDINLGAFDP